MIDKLRRLIQEIHRRSLWQVLGIYLAGSLAAFELSGSLTDATGLPDWFPTFALGLLILGLPIVMATAYVQERTDESVRKEAEARPDPSTTQRAGLRRTLLTWRNVTLGGLGALALWGAVATALRLSTDGPDEPVAAATPRIGVLPIDNLTGDESRQFLADGLHDEVITRLQQVGGLRVISRTSTLRYRDARLSLPEIAAELDADVLLEATLQSSGGLIRLNAQLIDGSSDEHLWAATFDRTIDPDELLTVQTDLALEVARILAVQLTPAERSRVTAVGTTSREAQRQYLLGIAYRNSGRPEDLPASIEAYQRALDLDPAFALAYSALAESYMIVAHGPVPPWEAFPPGETAARAALAIRPEMAEALTTLADVTYHYRWAWAEAESRFEEALEINPSHATAHWWLAGLLSTLRRHDEAVEHARSALPLDPRNVIGRGFVARVMFWAGRGDAALEVLDEGLVADPNQPVLLEMKGTILVRTGESEEERVRGLGLLERAASTGPGLARFSYGAALAALGRTRQASEILAASERLAESDDTPVPENEPAQYVPRYYMAWIAAELGQTRRALDLLEEAAEVREAPLIWLNIDPAFRSLRDEPRFEALLDRMGLAVGRFDERGAPVAP